MPHLRSGVVVAMLAVAGVPLLAQAPAADRPDKRALVKDAKAAYYSLRRQGVESFQCTFTPNWDVILSVSALTAQQKESSKRAAAALHFAMAYDARGRTTVTHREDTPAANEQTQRGRDQIVKGMEQLVSGFYQTYDPFMITSPFPAVESEYTLEEAGAGYRLAYKEDATTSIVTRMTKTFAIVETIITAADFDSVIKPTFTTSEEGYVLSAYTGSYKPRDGKPTTLVDARIEYQIVDGVRVPAKLVFDSALGPEKNTTEIAFSNYAIKRR